MKVMKMMKHAWKEQDGLVLGAAFMGGFLVQFCIGFYKRREHWYKVHRMQEEFIKRSEAHTAYMEALYEGRKPSSS